MDEKQKDARFTKGYNEGYLLSRFEPDLLKKITQKSKEYDPRFEGITAGRRAHERELFLEKLQKSRAMQQWIRRPRM